MCKEYRKVLHINCNYVSTTLHQLLVRNLEQTGIDNSVFVPIHSKIRPVIEPDSNVCVKKCFNSGDRFFYKIKQQKIYKALQEQYKIETFNCIHAHTLFTDGGVAWNIKKDFGIPYIVTVRNTDVNVFFKYRVALRQHGREILRGASAIVFLSPSYRDEVYRNYVERFEEEEFRKKTFIIPNGIDPFWLKNAPEPNKKQNDTIIRCIYAGAVNKNKNIKTTLCACDVLKGKGYSVFYTVIGKIESKKIYQMLIDRDYVTYISPQPKEKLIEFYRANDIFVMPSRTETFGLVYAEALSQGLPIIYTRGQGFDGQFPDGEVGYSVDSSDPNQIAETILKLAEEKEKMTPICINKSRKFDWEKISRSYSEIYKQFGEK